MTAPAKPNAELAYAVLDLTKAFPKSFDMEQWVDMKEAGLVDLAMLTEPSCGTTACLAGWTVAQAGYQLDRRGDVYKGDQLVTTDIERFAARMLGITDADADYLFYVEDSYVGTAVEEIFGPRPTADRYAPGLIEGDTADEQRDNAYARYEADEARYES